MKPAEILPTFSVVNLKSQEMCVQIFWRKLLEGRKELDSFSQGVFGPFQFVWGSTVWSLTQKHWNWPQANQVIMANFGVLLMWYGKIFLDGAQNWLPLTF